MDWNRYFDHFENYFWQWEEQGEVAAVPEASTIAYRTAIVHILTVLQPQGIPPFGTLLLAMAFTSRSKFNSDRGVKSFIENYAFRSAYEEDIQNSLKFLAILNSMGPTYHFGERRLLLFSTIFNGCHNSLSANKSRRVLDNINKKIKSNQTWFLRSPLSTNQLYHDLRPLALLYKKYPTADRLLNALKGVAEVEEGMDEIEIDSFPLETTEEFDFVSQLMNNKQTFKAGALIKRIWSSANIPMHQKVPSGQPFGGVADITNKGEFDKLLISEYANEDITFLSRLANKEAMYFNREAPPTENNEDRIILLDVSLKNWGRSKAVAFGLLLAIAHHPKVKKQSICYSVGRRSYSLSIEDLDGVIEAVQILDTSMTAADGLRDLFAKNDFSKNEVFFISTKESSEQLEVGKVLEELNHPIDYWFYPDKEGKVDIYKKYRSGKKHHQSFELPLKELWTPKKKKDTLPSSPKWEGKKHDFEILVPTPNNIKHIIASDKECFLLTSDRVLLKRVHAVQGNETKEWQVLHLHVPFVSGFHGVGYNHLGEFVLISCQPDKDELILFNVKTEKKVKLDFKHHKDTRFKMFFYEDTSFYMYRHSTVVKVDMTGNVTVEDDIDNRFQKRAYAHGTLIQNLRKKITTRYSILKHVHTVSYSSPYLEFNHHQMFLNQQGELKIKNKISSKLSNGKVANKNENGAFEFSDGSRIEFLKCGLIVLTSGNASVPTIYITSLLGVSLAMYADGKFAGNERYFRDSHYVYRQDKYYSIQGQKNDRIPLPAKIIETFLAIPSKADINVEKIYHYRQLEKIDMNTFYYEYIHKFLLELYKHAN
ncbi:MAG: hypothetical protein P1U56_07030 [Saprospiraceae bacterium]|nr:hypothetical protein [Saprospiraceae bacterium]